MHPYVYKKQHKPLRFVLRIFIFIMILCPVTLANSQSCSSHAVKNVNIFSMFSKGWLRIEGNRVVTSDSTSSNELFSVTIDKHFILLYHIKSGKFICWNKSFTKLVARRNPTNLTYCKFEEKPSKEFLLSYATRYVTTHENREVEIRINKNGTFATIKYIYKCLKRMAERKPNRRNVGTYTPKFLKHLNPEDKSTKVKDAYSFMMKCASPDFITRVAKDNCATYLREFCDEMKDRKNKGRNITSELTDFCKNTWTQRN